MGLGFSLGVQGSRLSAYGSGMWDVEVRAKD